MPVRFLCSAAPPAFTTVGTKKQGCTETKSQSNSIMKNKKQFKWMHVASHAPLTPPPHPRQDLTGSGRGRGHTCTLAWRSARGRVHGIPAAAPAGCRGDDRPLVAHMWPRPLKPVATPPQQRPSVVTQPASGRLIQPAWRRFHHSSRQSQ